MRPTAIGEDGSLYGSFGREPECVQRGNILHYVNLAALCFRKRRIRGVMRHNPPQVATLQSDHPVASPRRKIRYSFSIAASGIPDIG